MSRTNGGGSTTALVLVGITALVTGCSSTSTMEETGPTVAPSLAPAVDPSPSSAPPYPIVDTGQSTTYDASREIPAPAPGQAFAGQDAQIDGNLPSYTLNGDGTVTDNVTGLMWTPTPDLNGDGVIDIDDKLTASGAVGYASAVTVGGYDDWRLPTIKELYSLIDFSGIDPSGYEGTDTSGLTPFIDTGFFSFGYGDTASGERIIDAQMATSTIYVDTTMRGDVTMFGVNFADGRIKGYGTGPMPGSDEEKGFYVYYVRGDSYGANVFVDNGDGTITDTATGLMWAQTDSGTGMNWEEALAWAEAANAESYLGYGDWRLPNAKELQSLVDYSRSPGTTNSAAIAPVFHTTAITNEARQPDYPFFWSSTTHASWAPDRAGATAVYVAFGRAMGNMNGSWMDVHGAGAQRSDPKSGDPSDFATGRGPQGDAIRIENFVRLVRDSE